MRAVAIGLKIPDNAAYTALVTLRRLGVHVERVERSEIWFFADDVEPGTLAASVRADATMFNPNKHHLVALDDAAPRAGEVWIEPLAPDRVMVRATAWRLFDEAGAPAARETLANAVERLLCNPAIERAVY